MLREFIFGACNFVIRVAILFLDWVEVSIYQNLILSIDIHNFIISNCAYGVGLSIFVNYIIAWTVFADQVWPCCYSGCPCCSSCPCCSWDYSWTWLRRLSILSIILNISLFYSHCIGWIFLTFNSCVFSGFSWSFSSQDTSSKQNPQDDTSQGQKPK